MGMPAADLISVGVDSTSGRKAYTYAALGRDLRLVAMAEGEIDELSAFLRAQTQVAVAVNAPSHLNAGVVRKRLEIGVRDHHAVRGADIREAEFELHGRGIAVSGTPHSQAQCPAWMQLGFELYRELAELGFKAYPNEQSKRVWLETHPHAAFCVLLGGTPLPKPTLEGRLQRGLLLFEKGVRIRDPMSFLEEITRHRLLHGLLPVDMLLAPEQLDALVAAYTAWVACETPADVTRLGNRHEGYVTLPASGLLEKYQSA